jgi:superfamily II DNA or RNA helicase
MEWATSNGEVLEATFDDELDEPLANQRLRSALTLEGNWLTSVLDEAHRELTALRRDVADAAGLVLAADQVHARGIATLLESRHGVEPVVVTCDDPEANERIESFAKGTAPWLVAVRMVSEGVDIPRLRVGVYAAPVTSELYFRQAVGRLVRVVDADSGETASCFIPDDPRLRSYAVTIRAQRDHVLNEEVDVLLDEPRTEDGTATRTLSGFRPITSEATDAGGIYEGTEFSAQELARAAELKALTPQTSGLPTPAVAVLLRLVRGDDTKDPAVASATPAPAHRHRRDLRTANHRMVGRIAYAHGVDHHDVNAALNAALHIDGVATASIEQLTSRLRLGQVWLSSGRPPAEEISA